MELVSRILDLGQSFLDRQPTLALALGGALIAVFFTAAMSSQRKEDGGAAGALWPTAGRRLLQIGWALMLVGFLIGAIVVTKRYLNEALANFCQTHGRVSEANYNAVQTIWGPEQDQHELTAEFGYDEEVTERVEFEDPSKPALIKKKMVHRTVPGNPFESAHHEVTLRQNPRKKGSAIYPGYETDNRFMYKLRYPGEHDVKASLRFPLPSTAMVCNDLVANLDGQSVLNRLQISEGALLLELDVQKGWAADLEIRFKSRGVSYWYFQVSEARVIRDFMLTLHLPDLPTDKLNYPEGCMTPTAIAPAKDGRGCDLIYRLGNAVSSKGMGIALAKPEQPGKITNAVLSETPTAWTLLFAATLFSFSLAGVRRGVLFGILVGAAAAFAYGLLGNFHDIVLGFWGSAVVVLVPLFALLAWLLTCAVEGMAGKLLAVELILFGVLYPSVAGLDADRQTLYLNICAVVLLAITTWQIIRRTGRPAESTGYSAT